MSEGRAWLLVVVGTLLLTAAVTCAFIALTVGLAR